MNIYSASLILWSESGANPHNSAHLMHRYAVLCAALVLSGVPKTCLAQSRFYEPLPFSDNITVPEFPTSRETCEVFREDVKIAAKHASDAHDKCLKDAEGSPSGSEQGQDACAKRACQALHDRRDKLQKLMSHGYTKCIDAYVSREQSGVLSHGSGTSTMDDFRFALARGPISAVRRLAREKIGGIVDATFGAGSAAVKSGLHVGIATTMLTQQLGDVQSACQQKSNTALAACNEVIESSLRNLPAVVPRVLRSDPAIFLIQQGVLERLNLELSNVRHALEQATDTMEQVDNGRPTKRKSTVRSSSTAVIEND